MGGVGGRSVGRSVGRSGGLSVYLYALLTKREVKMIGYWPSSLFAKRERGQYLVF